MSEGLVGSEGFAVDASVIKADANRARGVAGTEVVDWNKGDGATRAVREYLDALEESNPASDGSSAPPDPPTAPKNISLTDPAARWTAASDGPAFYAYSTNYLIDLQAGIIVDVEATPAHRTQEVESTRTRVDRFEERFVLGSEQRLGGSHSTYGLRVRSPALDIGRELGDLQRYWQRAVAVQSSALRREDIRGFATTLNL